MKEKKSNKAKLLHGNEARLGKDFEVTPLNLTNTIVPKKEQKGNEVPIPTIENIALSKEFVDENHK